MTEEASEKTLRDVDVGPSRKYSGPVFTSLWIRENHQGKGGLLCIRPSKGGRLRERKKKGGGRQKKKLPLGSGGGKKRTLFLWATRGLEGRRALMKVVGLQGTQGTLSQVFFTHLRRRRSREREGCSDKQRRCAYLIVEEKRGHRGEGENARVEEWLKTRWPGGKKTSPAGRAGRPPAVEN